MNIVNNCIAVLISSVTDYTCVIHLYFLVLCLKEYETDLHCEQITSQLHHANELYRDEL